MKAKGLFGVLYSVCAVITAACVFLFVVCFCAYFVQRKFVYPVKYEKEIVAATEEFGVDKFFVFATVKAESGFNADRKSVKNAKGLMQLTDETARYVADMLGETDYDIFEPNTNVRFGCRYIKYLSGKFSNEFTLAAAYNAGEGTVGGWLKNPEYSDDGVTLKVVPYAETAEYVKKISKNLEKYKSLYGNILDKK